jgi:hypothetical protein
MELPRSSKVRQEKGSKTERVQKHADNISSKITGAIQGWIDREREADHLTFRLN